MSDEWARPARRRSDHTDGTDPTDVDRIEITLDGPGSADAAPQDRVGRPNWRRTIAVAALCGAVLGIVVGVVVITGDDDDASPPSTTDDPVQLAADITAPPTLPPLETLPRPDIAEIAPPTATVVPDLPVYPVVTSDQAGPPPGSDLVAAASRIGTGLARHSRTDYRIGSAGYRLIVDITHDPVDDRYEMVLELNDVVQTLLVDVAGGSSYFGVTDGDGWQRVDNEQLADGTSTSSMAEFATQMLLGPIRPDTIDEAITVTAGDIVSIDGGQPVQQFLVSLPASAIPEWVRYRFGPVNEAAPPAFEEVVDYAVYLSSDGRIVQVDGASEFGNTVQEITHSIEVLAERPVIELPDPATIRASTGTAGTTVPPDTTTPVADTTAAPPSSPSPPSPPTSAPG